MDIKLRHLGIIMDGNRRWAKKKGRPLLAGHQEGAETLKRITLACRDLGIEYLTVFAFSLENWKRPSAEVNYLMKLAERFLEDEIGWANQEGVRIGVVGQKELFEKSLQKKIAEAERQTGSNKGIRLSLASSYGGRGELAEAVRQIASIRPDPKKIDQKMIERNLWTSGLPDPDLIIRTGGERRLSGFLLWRSAYAELYFSNKFWPDFNKKDLTSALADYSRRQRRFGR